MAESFLDTSEDSKKVLSEQPTMETAPNGRLGDVEMSDDAALSQPTIATSINTTDPSISSIAATTIPSSTGELAPSIPVASTATPPTAAVASPGPTQPAAPVPRTSSNPPTTPSAAANLAPPPAPSPHGSPTRVYLNQNVTPHLLEAMKYLAVYEPEKPLKWLADFLSERSREIEGT